jgi:hypothetical protein
MVLTPQGVGRVGRREGFFVFRDDEGQDKLEIEDEQKVRQAGEQKLETRSDESSTISRHAEQMGSSKSRTVVKR